MKPFVPKHYTKTRDSLVELVFQGWLRQDPQGLVPRILQMRICLEM
jgi:hypothetical protein